MAATSSFTEGSSVFGGQANLLQAITNIFSVYEPEVIAIHTTCLSETIGDDMPQIAAKAKKDGKVPEGKDVIYCNTPSYAGSHVTGFSNMVMGMVNCLGEKSEEAKLNRINLIPGWVEPADMRELKRMMKEMGVSTLMFPDTSGVLDTGYTGKAQMYPDGGTHVSDLRTMGRSRRTIALGPTASEAAMKKLDTKCGVAGNLLELPIGLSATDRFITTLHDKLGIAVPASIKEERARLVDMIADMQQYTYKKRVALWGDPDQLVSLTEFLVDLDMQPVYVVTGTPGKQFDRRMSEVVGDRVPDAKFKQGAGADMYLMHQWIKKEPVDLLIGNTYGKYISRDDDIPLIRHGFPILDRVGHQYFPTVGYTGAMRLLDQILNALMDRQDRDAPEAEFELVM